MTDSNKENNLESDESAFTSSQVNELKTLLHKIVDQSKLEKNIGSLQEKQNNILTKLDSIQSKQSTLKSTVNDKNASTDEKYKKLLKSLASYFQQSTEINEQFLEDYGFKKWTALRILKIISKYIIPLCVVGLTIVQLRVINNQNKIIEEQGKLENTFKKKEFYSTRSKKCINLIQNIIDEARKQSITSKIEIPPRTIDEVVEIINKGLEPYIDYSTNFENDQFRSPEKGDILSFILNSDISSDSQNKILRAKFDFAYVEILKITNKKLNNLRFKNLIAKEVTFDSCNLDNIYFEGSNITDLHFTNCSEIGSLYLSGGEFSDISITNCKLVRKPTFNNTKIDKLVIKNCDKVINMAIRFDDNSKRIKLLDLFHSNLNENSIKGINFNQINELRINQCKLNISNEICVKDRIKLNKSIIVSDKDIFENCKSVLEVKSSILKTASHRFKNVKSINLGDGFLFINPSRDKYQDSIFIKKFEKFITSSVDY